MLGPEEPKARSGTEERCGVPARAVDGLAGELTMLVGGDKGRRAVSETGRAGQISRPA